MKPETITVKVSKRNSLNGKRFAKLFGGKYDPKTGTWEIPANRPEIMDLPAYYLVRVDKPGIADADEYDELTDSE